jgi:MFS family permease
MPAVSPLLILYGAYNFIVGMAGTAGLTATQNAVPSEMRGFAVSMQAFMYTLIGLALGPTLVAFATDHIYHDPKSVGLSIFTVSAPVSVVSALLLWRALAHYRRTRARVIRAPPAGEMSASPAAQSAASPAV